MAGAISEGRRGASWVRRAVAFALVASCQAANPLYQGRPVAGDAGEAQTPVPPPDAARATPDVVDQRVSGEPPRPVVEAGATDSAAEAANPGSDIVAYWKFDETPNAVKAVDSTGFHNDAPVTRVGAGIVFVAGRIGSAADVGTETAWLAANSSPSFDSIASQLTIAAWVNRRASADPVHVIASRMQAGRGFSLEIANGLLRVALQSAARMGSNLVMRDMPPQSWSHVAVTLDGTKGHMYVDGIESASFDWTDPVPNPTGAPVVIGGGQNAGGMVDRLFGGQIDELVIARRALTAAEILAMARGGPPPAR